MDSLSDNNWITATDACRILGIERATFRNRVVKAAKIRVKRIPGAMIRYSRIDVERVASESVSLAQTA